MGRIRREIQDRKGLALLVLRGRGDTLVVLELDAAVLVVGEGKHSVIAGAARMTAGFLVMAADVDNGRRNPRSVVGDVIYMGAEVAAAPKSAEADQQCDG